MIYTQQEAYSLYCITVAPITSIFQSMYVTQKKKKKKKKKKKCEQGYYDPLLKNKIIFF
jgi:formylmethanofuran:tetrahydromethanopterin formyltransferase